MLVRVSKTAEALWKYTLIRIFFCFLLVQLILNGTWIKAALLKEWFLSVKAMSP